MTGQCKLRLSLPLILLVLGSGCQKKESLEPLSEYESADLLARAHNFQVYPDVRFLEKYTDLLRKAHFILEPKATTVPPMVVYDTDDSLEDVANFYGEKYETGGIAEDEINNFSAVRPPAYYTSGDLAGETAALPPILEQLKIQADLSKAVGPYRGAHFAPKFNMPRVTLQRPYFDVTRSEVVDRTLIVMVKE